MRHGRYVTRSQAATTIFVLPSEQIRPLLGSVGSNTYPSSAPVLRTPVAIEHQNTVGHNNFSDVTARPGRAGVPHMMVPISLEHNCGHGRDRTRPSSLPVTWRQCSEGRGSPCLDLRA